MALDFFILGTSLLSVWRRRSQRVEERRLLKVQESLPSPPALSGFLKGAIVRTPLTLLSLSVMTKRVFIAPREQGAALKGEKRRRLKALLL